MVRRVSAGVAGGTGSEVWVLRRRVSGSTFPSRIWVAGVRGGVLCCSAYKTHAGVGEGGKAKRGTRPEGPAFEF